MKRVLLDHCVPRRVWQALVDCDTATAFQRGWAEFKNGALLQAAEDAGFDVLVTADRNLRYQQQLAHRRIDIVELPTNALPALLPHWPAIAEAVNRINPAATWKFLSRREPCFNPNGIAAISPRLAPCAYLR